VDPLIPAESGTVHVKESHLESIRFGRRMILEELVDLEDSTGCIMTIEVGDIEEGGRWKVVRGREVASRGGQLEKVGIRWN